MQKYKTQTYLDKKKQFVIQYRKKIGRYFGSS
jgi:hypothetical protein